MSDDSELLFVQGDLAATLGNSKAKAVEEVASLDRNYLLKVSEQDLIDSLTAKYQVQPIELERESIVADGPRDVDITHRGEMAFEYDQEEVTIRGTALTIIVPFHGDPMLLRLRPSTFNFNPPRGRIIGQELHLEFRGQDLKGEQLKREYERVLADVEQYVSWQRGTVDAHNQSMRATITQAVTQRKAKLKKDMDLVASLGIPVRRREIPDTFVAPQVRRKPKIELPKVAAGPYKPEPVLADEHYEFILKVIQNMTLVMERSPTAFAKMEEEHLRHHFLVPLNGHFEGDATGETFNYHGKTDILIRHKGRNVFIAECKIWHGDKAFTATIDQLLGYTSWRDTKTAIILFNRNRDFSAVLAKIAQLVKAHPNHKRELPIEGETCFRHVLHHRDDKNRELILTVLAFDVPSQKPEEAGA
ncbi:MAG: hypothetical protein IH986_14630 [Planctomycetes bacterium]|nr:hypothetical protein [Planctomycetota bacterium]